MNSHISSVGATNKGMITPPKMLDHSGSEMLKVRPGAGSNVKKQVPGMNQSIVPLIPEPK